MLQIIAGRTSFNRFPMLVLSAAFAAGILCASLNVLSLAFALACAACASLISALAYGRRRLEVASVSIVVAFTCAGAILSIGETRGVAANRVRRFYEDGRIVAGEPVELTGVLERAPESAPDGLFISLRVESLRFRAQEHAAQGALELFAPVRDASAKEAYEQLELRRGARVRVPVVPERAERFRNPGVSSYTEFLERRELDARAVIKSPLLMERLDDERVALPLVLLDEWRAWLVEHANRQFSIETAGVLNAAILGNRHGLTRATSDSFRAGGTFHILVISGLHVTFIGGLVWALMRRVTKRRACAWAISTLCVWLYALAVGGETSVTRAALMFTSATLAPIVGRRSNTTNALGGAALALFVWRPGNLFDPSFQLTFLSVLSIVALVWPLLTKLRETGEWRPTQATPYPPRCPRWWLVLGETLFWRERRWKRELAQLTHSYRLFKTPLAARLERWRLQTLLRYIFTASLVSACVQVGMLPALALYFHRLSLASLLLNIWVGILMVALSFSALAAMLSAQLDARLAAPFVRLAEHANWLMTHGVDPFEAINVASFRMPEYTGVWASVYALYFAPLIIIAIALTRWHPVIHGGGGSYADASNKGNRRIVKFACAAHVLLFSVIVFHPLSARRPEGRLRIDFLDVGQADAALLTFPDGTTLLVDGGGSGRHGLNSRAYANAEEDVEAFERDARGIGEAVVSEYLWWRGLDAVDYILATHAHADHLEGLNDVAMNFRVSAALVARAPTRDAEFARFAETASRWGVPIHFIGRGDTLRFGDVTIDVLWPPFKASTDAPSGNDDSIVLRLRFGRRTFILTGDIEARAEANLVAARENLRCDALKVAHHGSKTSSTDAFVNATRPALAVISVGLDSPFGHPHTEVLERWRANGARILTTGQRGTITLSTNGTDLRVETYIEKP